MRQPKVLDRAIQIGKALSINNYFRCRHYAFIFKGNEILIIGENKKHRHPLMDYWGYNEMCKTHAEFDAIIRFNQIDCRKYDFLTFRIDMNGEINNGKPCQKCQSLIDHFGFRRVWYSGENGKILLG